MTLGRQLLQDQSVHCQSDQSSIAGARAASAAQPEPHSPAWAQLHTMLLLHSRFGILLPPSDAHGGVCEVVGLFRHLFLLAASPADVPAGRDRHRHQCTTPARACLKSICTAAWKAWKVVDVVRHNVDLAVSESV